METASEEEEREKNEEEEEEEEEEDDPRSSDEEGGLSPVAMTTEPELIEKTTEDAEIHTASKQESPQQQQQQHGGKEMCGLDSFTRTPHPPVHGASLSQCNSAYLEERAVVPDQLHMEAQVSASICPVGFYCGMMLSKQVQITQTPTMTESECGPLLHLACYLSTNVSNKV
uniref:histone H3.v1-like n=1 Tax=Epinephelus lanceolatus TaxID=310571 RepID=UPI0014456354|nr:histone H3.v1-like [Epinephelus lanceolatus]